MSTGLQINDACHLRGQIGETGAELNAFTIEHNATTVSKDIYANSVFVKSELDTGSKHAESDGFGQSDPANQRSILVLVGVGDK